MGPFGRDSVPLLQKVVADGRHPALVRLVEAGVFVTDAGPNEDFEYGLDLLLDAIEALLEPQ